MNSDHGFRYIDLDILKIVNEFFDCRVASEIDKREVL
jgi:hypothetical protein